jgi:hypothetical protein
MVLKQIDEARAKEMPFKNAANGIKPSLTGAL